MFRDAYQAACTNLTASEETREKILNLKRQERRGIFKPTKLLIVAAMMALLVACAAVFDAGAMLEAAFGENGRGSYDYEEFTYQTKNGKRVTRMKLPGERSALDQELAETLVAPYVFEVDQQAVSGDYTMTVLSCLHDPVTQTGIAYLTLENSNGFPDMHVYNDGEVHWYPEEGGSKWLLFSEPLGLFYIDEALSSETKLYLTCHYVCIQEYTQMRIYFMDTDQGVSFPLPEETGMKQLSLADGDILLTPIGFACNRNRFSVSYIDLATIMICYEDGTEKYISWYDPRRKERKVNSRHLEDPIQNYVLASEIADDPRTHKSYLLNFIVDIDQVSSVVINGEEFFVE